MSIVNINYTDVFKTRSEIKEFVPEYVFGLSSRHTVHVLRNSKWF